MGTQPSNPARGERASGPRRVAALPDALRAPATMARTLLAEVFEHARECYPEECCGLLTGPAGGAPCQVARCTNMQSLRYAKGESGLDAAHGFWIDPVEIQRALEHAEARGEVLRTIYHSHIDTEAYLSQTDVEAALGPDGCPVWAGVDQLVVAVKDGSVQGGALFRWDSDAAAFVGRRLREAS